MRNYEATRNAQPLELENSILVLGLLYIAAMVAGFAILAGAWYW